MKRNYENLLENWAWHIVMFFLMFIEFFFYLLIENVAKLVFTEDG